jgi:hypothetical protein
LRDSLTLDRYSNHTKQKKVRILIGNAPFIALKVPLP